MSDSLEKLDAAGLARLLIGRAHLPWDDADSAVALRRQLESPLIPDIYASPLVDRTVVEAVLTKSENIPTFSECLLNPDVDLSLLIAIKMFSKNIMSDPANPLGPDAARVLYFAAITAAWIRGDRITKMRDSEISDGIAWSKRRPGAEGLATLFAAGLQVASKGAAQNP